MNRTRKSLAVIATAATLTGTALLAVPATASAATGCTGSWSIGIGGLNDNNSTAWNGRVDQTVGYNSFDPSGSSGINEVNRLITNHRNACPGDVIHAGGYSEGAAIMHIWDSRHPAFGNLTVDLYGDPKNPAQTGGPGFAQTDLGFMGAPIAGSDNNFGNDTIEHCNPQDHICHGAASWAGYLWGGAHSYNLQVR